MKYCLGTVQFGLNYGIQGNGQPERTKVYEMLSYAIQNGIDVLDTASAYGKAEEVLGSYFQIFPDDIEKVGVVSKLKPDAFKGMDSCKWAEITIQNAMDSLKNIGLGCFKAYLFHNASYIFERKAVAALNAVRESGLSRHIGVSVYTPEEAMKALEYPQITVVQIPYNLFDRRLDKCGFFKRAKEQGVVVYARSSLLQGLVMMDPDNLPDRVSFAKPYLNVLLNICKENGLTPLEAAIGYVGQKSGIDYIVFGVDNLAQLTEYISLKEVDIPKDIIKKIDTVFDDVDERLVNPVLWR